MAQLQRHAVPCCVLQNTSLKEITNTINVTGVTRVKLSEDDIRKVVNTLIADCRCGQLLLHRHLHTFACTCTLAYILVCYWCPTGDRHRLQDVVTSLSLWICYERCCRCVVQPSAWFLAVQRRQWGHV